MKMNKKNKIIIVTSSLALLLGITYQNCGQMQSTNQSIAPEAKQIKSALLQDLKAGESKDITITLKDGTQFKGKLSDKQTYLNELKTSK